jgi:hypothetical protein
MVMLYYKLEIPLCTSEFGSQKAIAYASKVQAGLANKLGADVGYSHLITKNPFHKDWRVTFWSEQAYTLDYLADFVELPKKLSKKQEVSGLGRNCTCSIQCVNGHIRRLERIEVVFIILG